MNANWADIASFWPSRRTYDPRRVAELGLPEPQAQFLLEVGLPIGDSSIWTVSFEEPTEDLPSLEDLELPAPTELERHSTVVLGLDYGDPVCMKATSGQVFYLSQDHGVLLMNSAPDLLVASLTAYAKFCRLLVPPTIYDEALVEKMKQGLWSNFERLDSALLQAKSTFWREFLFS